MLTWGCEYKKALPHFASCNFWRHAGTSYRLIVYQRLLFLLLTASNWAATAAGGKGKLVLQLPWLSSQSFVRVTEASGSFVISNQTKSLALLSIIDLWCTGRAQPQAYCSTLRPVDYVRPDPAPVSAPQEIANARCTAHTCYN